MPRPSFSTRSEPARRYAKLTSVISQLAPRRRPQVGGDVQDVVVVKIEPSDGVWRAGPAWLLFEPSGAALRVELDHSIALRVANPVGEDGGAAGAARRSGQRLRETVAVENVVAEGQRNSAAAHELSADDEGLCDALGVGLGSILDPHSQVPAVAEQAPETLLVVGCGDHQDFPDPSQHEGGQRVINHGLVIDWHELFAHP